MYKFKRARWVRVVRVAPLAAGFTLIEMLLVLALVTLIAVVSVLYSVPAVSQFSCLGEIESVTFALGRARHIAQYWKQGNARFEIRDDQYLIFVDDAGEHGGQTVLADQIDRQSTVPIFSTAEILFAEYSGGLFVEDNGEHYEIKITVGGEDFGCQKIIKINNVGAIL